MESKKERTAYEILKSAQIYFIDKGIENTTVIDISQGANITRRTFYRYYKSKEEVAYEVIILNLIEWQRIQKEIVNKILNDNLRGLKALEKYLKISTEYMMKNKNFVKIFIEFDRYFIDDKKYELSQKLMKRFYEVSHFSEKQIYFFIQQGIKEGEVKLFSDEALNLYMATMSSFLWRGGQQLYLSQCHIENEFGVLLDHMFNCQIDLYIAGLKK